MSAFLSGLFSASVSMSLVSLMFLLVNHVVAKRIPARFRYYICFIVMVGFLFPFKLGTTFMQIRVPIANAALPSQAGEVTGFVSDGTLSEDPAPASKTIQAPIPYSIVLFGIWAVGALTLMTHQVRAYRKFVAAVRRFGKKVDRCQLACHTARRPSRYWASGKTHCHKEMHVCFKPHVDRIFQANHTVAAK